MSEHENPLHCSCTDPETIEKSVVSDAAEKAVVCANCGAVEIIGDHVRIDELELEDEDDFEIEGWVK